MRTKTEYYVSIKAKKEFYEKPPTFTPQINKPTKKLITQEDTLFAGKDHAYKLIEKGKEYKEKQKILTQLKEASQDPDLTFKPKVNDRKPKNVQEGPKWE
jgi:hypothetical protein